MEDIKKIEKENVEFTSPIKTSKKSTCENKLETGRKTYTTRTGKKDLQSWVRRKRSDQSGQDMHS